jgi:hypothetical protein
MQENVAWKGSPFWQTNDRQGRFEKLQALARKTIFAPEPNDSFTIGRVGDVIPIPDLPAEELFSFHSPNLLDDTGSGEVNACPATKTSAELSSLEAYAPVPKFPRSPLDERIAELEASIALDRASRLGASPRILANLRPEAPIQMSSLIEQSGITRLPNEITKKIIGFIEYRRDVSALSCVSKRWRVETMPALYSTLVLRGWDEIISCLTTIYLVDNIANTVVDLTIGEINLQPATDIY